MGEVVQFDAFVAVGFGRRLELRVGAQGLLAFGGALLVDQAEDGFADDGDVRRFGVTSVSVQGLASTAAIMASRFSPAEADGRADAGARLVPGGVAAVEPAGARGGSGPSCLCGAGRQRAAGAVVAAPGRGGRPHSGRGRVRGHERRRPAGSRSRIGYGRWPVRRPQPRAGGRRQRTGRGGDALGGAAPTLLRMLGRDLERPGRVLGRWASSCSRAAGLAAGARRAARSRPRRLLRRRDPAEAQRSRRVAPVRRDRPRARSPGVPRRRPRRCPRPARRR